MNVREFVKNAITEVVEGVADAAEAVKPLGASAGSGRVYGHVKENKIITDESNRPITYIDFDIALTQSDSTDTKGGIGVFLGPVGVGSQGESHGESTSHSRIKFKVPVVLPTK